jgi:hypothetical protein
MRGVNAQNLRLARMTGSLDDAQRHDTGVASLRCFKIAKGLQLLLLAEGLFELVSLDCRPVLNLATVPYLISRLKHHIFSQADLPASGGSYNELV